VRSVLTLYDSPSRYRAKTLILLKWGLDVGKARKGF
jgi:hypothetical protein